MSTYKLASGNTPTQATAQEMLDHCNKATSVGDIQPCVDEFERRLAKAKSRTHSRAGKELSKEFVDGKVAKITKNLASAQNALATIGGNAPTPTHTFVGVTSAVHKAIDKCNLPRDIKEILKSRA